MSNTFVRDMTSDFQFEVKVVMSLCELIDTPRSLAVYLMLKYQCYEGYLELQIDPNHYDNPRNFAYDRLATEILKKSPNIPISIDRKEAALESFWTSELSCFATNLRLSAQTFEYEHQVRREVAAILGPVNTHVLEEIQDMFAHGPGATASLPGRGLVGSDKYDRNVSLTVALYPFARSIMGENWSNSNSLPREVVLGNKFTTVPKNAKTDRGICAEPTLNMYVQRGIGKYIRKRLRKFGVDLTDQTRNQRLAQRAYFDGLATIDLSSASDSLSSGLVLSYFPEPWVELLSLCRSHRCNIGGEFHDLEKFSSMGNGYTFEIETVVFYAVCRAVVPKDEMDNVSVYGDDIVIPSRYADKVIEVLNFLGFKTNLRKSFLAGSFFESCGTDWFKGHNVRPFYLKGRKGKIPYALQVCNSIRVFAWNQGLQYGCDSLLRPLWVELYNSLPFLWKKCKVPLHFGDTGVIVSSLEAKPRKAHAHLEGWIVRHVTFRPVQRDKRTQGVLLSNLQRGDLSEIPTYGREPKRGFLGRVVPKKSISSRWTECLDWL